MCPILLTSNRTQFFWGSERPKAQSNKRKLTAMTRIGRAKPLKHLQTIKSTTTILILVFVRRSANAEITTVVTLEIVLNPIGLSQGIWILEFHCLFRRKCSMQKNGKRYYTKLLNWLTNESNMPAFGSSKQSLQLVLLSLFLCLMKHSVYYCWERGSSNLPHIL